MNFRRVVNLRIYGISVFLFMVAAADHSALAWTWNYRGVLYTSPNLCVQADSGIDHQRPDTLSGNIAYANCYALSGGCGAGLNLPYGWAAVRLDVYKWNGTDWAVCRGTNWKLGATGTNQWGPWGPGDLLTYGGSSSCGPGWYGTMAIAYVWDGSAWRGGGLWSGAEFVP